MGFRLQRSGLFFLRKQTRFIMISGLGSRGAGIIALIAYSLTRQTMKAKTDLPDFSSRQQNSIIDLHPVYI